MRLEWLAIILCAGWWMGTAGLIAPQSSSAAWALVIGFLVLALARGKESRVVLGRTGLALLAPLLGFLLLHGLPVGIGPLVLMGTSACSVLAARFPALRFLAAAGSVLGAVLAFQLLGVWTYWRLGPKLHDASWLLEPVAFAVRALGGNAGVSGDKLHVVSSDAVASYAPGFEHLGLFAALLIVSGAVPILWLYSARPWRAGAALIAIVGGYCIVRYLALVLAFRTSWDMSVFWKTGPTLISFLPLAAVLQRCISLRFPQRIALPVAGDAPSVRKSLRYGAAVALTWALVASAVTFQDPGRTKQGRVWFDEYHSDWEWTGEPLDRENYGFRTTYNYYNLYEYLGAIWNVARNEEELTPERLKQCDVLILKMPTKPYGSSEVDAIVEYVENGGGLWLIGDHTDVFGSSTYLNGIAAQFGIHYRFDCQYEIETGSLSLYKRPRVAPHAVVSRLPPFLFATSCTLDCGVGVDPVMTGTRLRTLPGDYSNKNFFPRTEEYENGDYKFGPFVQCAAATRGLGRVLAFTDSTVFSNFFVFLPGKPELARASVEWLNRSNWLLPWRACLASVAAAMGVMTCVWGRRLSRQWSMFVFLAGACAGYSVGVLGMRALAAGFEMPVPPRDLRYVAFDMEHSSAFLPYERLQVPGDSDYSTFFTWVQRTGLTPAVHESLEECLESSLVVAVVEPRKPFGAEELDAVVSYVERGGALLVLDGGPPVLSDSTDQILRRFGMARGEAIPPTATIEGPYAAIPQQDSWAIVGGVPLLRMEDGTPVVAWRRFGSGRVIACGLSKVFWSSTMGTVSVSPTDTHLAIYALQYALLDAASGVEPSSLFPEERPEDG